MTKPTGLDVKVADNIKAMRIWAKFTQLQVATHLGIAYQSYQKMEKGTHSFRLSTLDKLASLYDVKADAFIDGDFFGSDAKTPLAIKMNQLFQGLTLIEKQRAIDSVLEIKYGVSKK